MSGLVLGCIADDYTGASDLANTLTRAGLRTVQTIGAPSETLALPNADAVVIALKSRSAPVAEAVAMARSAQTWLQAHGAQHILFKICSTFDSTDAGNIGPVTEALRPKNGGALVLVTPAFPQTGRTVFMGNLFVGEVPLNESPLKDHPLNPMTDANLVRVLVRQSPFAVGLIRLADVEAGVEAIRARMAVLQEAQASAVIVDAVFDRHLEAIGAAALDGPLSVGASGLGLGLALALIRSGRIAPAGEADVSDAAPVGGAIACLAGSCSEATLGQIRAARAWMPVLDLDLDAIMTGQAEVARALDWAGPLLAAGPVLIASSADPVQVGAIQSRFGREASGHAIEQTLAAIAEGLVGMGVRRVVVAGGETSGAVIDRLDARVLAVGPEVAAGVPVMRVLSGPAAGMLVILKSGNFGGADFFADAHRMMA